MPPSGDVNKELVKHFFVNCEDDRWKCKCGKIVKQPKNKGYTNLINHLKSVHPDYKNELPSTSKQNDSFAGSTKAEPVTKKAEHLYCWLDWIFTEMKPFSFLQSALFQQ